jgi:S1-C subfamily serine protease
MMPTAHRGMTDMRSLLRPAAVLLVLLLAFSAHAAQGKLGFTVDAKFDRKLVDADIKEVVVTNVAAASAAERAGMKTGDVLQQLNGAPLVGSSARRFFAAMGKVKPGDKVALVVLRAGKPIALTLVAD